PPSAAEEKPASELQLLTPAKRPLLARPCRFGVRLGPGAMSAQCPVCPKADKAGRFTDDTAMPADRGVFAWALADILDVWPDLSVPPEADEDWRLLDNQ